MERKPVDWLTQQEGGFRCIVTACERFGSRMLSIGPDRRDFFSCGGHPWQFHPEVARIPRLVPSTWWWLFKDGWRKTEASRYGIWLRPPASCESDSICLNVWAQAEREERKEPSLSSEIWSSSYLRSGEEIPRCPHRSTGRRWYGELLPWSGTQKTSSSFQPMKGELFICGRLNNLFTPECVLFGDLPVLCLHVSLKPLRRHERMFFIFCCYLRGV